MGQAVWTGSISFGLVNIPVKLYPATEPKDVRFHLYDRRTGKRVRYERVTKDIDAPTFEPETFEPETFEEEDSPTHAPPASRVATGYSAEEYAATPASQPVQREDMVRGFELPSGDLVTVTDDELVSIAPERSRTIEIEEFVDIAEIDPVFYEKSYHVAPVRGMGAEKPYALLLRAMQGAGMVGIGRFVLRTKPHVVAIRPLKDALALETLFFADEVRSPAALTSGVADLAVSDREVKTARQLITAMAGEWIPEKHADVYREELLELLRSKPSATPAEATATTAETPVGDLMAALRASVEAAKRKGAKKAASSKRAG
jgi:DNA end-binding protein Ku